MSTNSSAALGARVRSERLRLGWTQRDTASRAGVSLRTYRRFELQGRTTVEQLVKIAGALGLQVELTALPDAGLVPDPKAATTRQRGVRHPRPKSAGAKQNASTSVATAARPATYQPVTLAEQQPAEDAASVEAIAKKYRDSIHRLAGTIVRSRLTNWTSAQVVRNSMSANGVADAEKPAYVAAILAGLSQLTAENITTYGCSPQELEAWRPGWRFDEPIHGALE